jgi:hypothetical protein
MTDEQKKELWGLLATLVKDQSLLNAKIKAMETVLLGNQELRQKYEAEEVQERQNLRLSTGIDVALELLRKSLLP